MDISFPKRDYKKPTEYEGLVQVIAETLKCKILICSFENLIENIYPNNQSFLGYHLEEIYGMKLTQLIYESDRFVLSDPPSGSNGENDWFPVRFIRKNQEVFPCHMKIKKISNLGMLYIINERQVMPSENQLIQNAKLMAIGQLAAGIAHEIRNPLTSLKGFIQLMKSAQTFQHQYLSIMEGEINQIDSIAKELMLLAKPNVTQLKLNNLISIIESCLTLLEGEAFQKRIQIHLDYHKEKLMIHCDEQKIKQVLVNIIKNGIEAMSGPGELLISIKERKPYVLIDIKDEGIGISEEILKKIGEPFFTTKVDGNGLGLMMCKKIIEEHNGKLTINSTVGVGTTFTVWLPLQPERII